MRPTRSPPSRSMNDPTAARACDMRLGLTSSASMLRDVSTATMTSTPRRVTVSSFAPHCGRASARIRNRAATTRSDALMIRFSRLALVDRSLINRRSPKVSRAFRRRRKDRMNRPIMTGRARSHPRYSGAPNRISVLPRPGPCVGAGATSWNLPQNRAGQEQLHQDEQGARIQEPGELLRVAGVAAHLDLRALHAVDVREDLF